MKTLCYKKKRLQRVEIIIVILRNSNVRLQKALQRTNNAKSIKQHHTNNKGSKPHKAAAMQRGTKEVAMLGGMRKHQRSGEPRRDECSKRYYATVRAARSMKNANTSERTEKKRGRTGSYGTSRRTRYAFRKRYNNRHAKATAPATMQQTAAAFAA
jgi:hypothetical protein